MDSKFRIRVVFKDNWSSPDISLRNRMIEVKVSWPQHQQNNCRKGSKYWCATASYRKTIHGVVTEINADTRAYSKIKTRRRKEKR